MKTYKQAKEKKYTGFSTVYEGPRLWRMHAYLPNAYVNMVMTTSFKTYGRFNYKRDLISELTVNAPASAEFPAYILADGYTAFFQPMSEGYERHFEVGESCKLGEVFS